MSVADELAGAEVRESDTVVACSETTRPDVDDVLRVLVAGRRAVRVDDDLLHVRRLDLRRATGRRLVLRATAAALAEKHESDDRDQARDDRATTTRHPTVRHASPQHRSSYRLVAH